MDTKERAMKRALVHYKVLIACLALGLVTVATWAFRRHDTHKTSPSTADLLSALPRSTGKSLVDQAVAKWSGEVQAHPKDDTGWSSLGDALMQKARETADLSYYGHAEAAYRKALDLNPQSVAAMNGMAWVNGGRHEFEKSIEWANRAIALDPRDNDAYGLIGDADVEMGDYDDAFKHYQQMLDIRPELPSYSRGAHLLQLTGDTRKAIWLMTKAIETGAPYAENTGWCRAQLALMLFQIGALVPADRTLQAALKLTPNNYQVLAAMGKVKAAERDYPAAIDYCKRAIAVVPQHDSLVALGDLYRLTGQPQEAEKQYALVEAVHQLQKSNGVRGDMQIAQFYADHDRNLPEALKMAQEEYQTRKNVYAADTLAWCYYKNGRYTEARDAIRAALSRRTPEALFLFHSGMIYAKLGDRPHAQLNLYQALSLNPKFSPIYASQAADMLKQIGSRPPDATLAATRSGGN